MCTPSVLPFQAAFAPVVIQTYMHILMVSPLVHRSNAFDAMTVPIDRLDNVANAVLYSMYVVTTETSSLVTPD